MKSSFVAIAAASTVSSAYAQGQAYAQCGGVGWSGSTTCVSGYTCQKTNDYYSQCVPGGGSSPTTTTRPSTTTTSRAGGSSPTGGSGSGLVSNAGVNVRIYCRRTQLTINFYQIAGLDFGCTIDGTCKTANIVDPGQIGIDQIQHFIKDDGLNTFRLPVGWQFLLNNNLGGTLDSNNWATYDKLVQGCLNAGAALCIVDIHNYAGGIVGQGGPTNAQFTSLWSQIAAKYKGNTRIAFGLMNEPVSEAQNLISKTW
jgi:endoglucanase